MSWKWQFAAKSHNLSVRSSQQRSSPGRGGSASLTFKDVPVLLLLDC
jgi:hypothetical protein